MTDILKDSKNKILEGGSIKTSVYFGPKDGELLDWVGSIPWGAFSLIVRGAIKAHISEDPSYTIPKFPENTENLNKTSFSKAFIINSEDYEVYEFIVSIDKFKRGQEIKKILNMYLEGRLEVKESAKKDVRRVTKEKREEHREKTKDSKLPNLLEIANSMDKGNFG